MSLHTEISGSIHAHQPQTWQLIIEIVKLSFTDESNHRLSKRQRITGGYIVFPINLSRNYETLTATYKV